MSLRTAFHTTESLLLERKQLHYLIDFFWQRLPYTRAEVYARISSLLHMTEAHVSDLNTGQIRKVAASFQKDLEDVAPCQSCKFRHKTDYGINRCTHPEMGGAYWLNPTGSTGRCQKYVQARVSKKRPSKQGS